MGQYQYPCNQGQSRKKDYPINMHRLEQSSIFHKNIHAYPGTKNQELPQILEDTYDSIFAEKEIFTISTENGFEQGLNKAIASYGCDIDAKDKIVIMGLDAATIGDYP